jgi:hypothetical protein
MASLGPRAISKPIPRWVIALGIFWGLASVVGLFFVGRKIVGTLRREQEMNLHEIGPEERALFFSNEELVQSGLWHATKKVPRDPSIHLQSSASMLATWQGVEGNDLIVQVISVRAGPTWISEPMLHQTARFIFSKHHMEEKTDPPIGPDHYPSYRYCKEEKCETRLVIGTLDQSGIYVSASGRGVLTAPDPDKLAAVMKTDLLRVVEYGKRHTLFQLDAGD